MLSVELTNLANMLDSVGQLKNVSQQAKTWSSRISDAVYATTVSIRLASSPRIIFVLIAMLQIVDDIFAYETNGEHSVDVAHPCIDVSTYPIAPRPWKSLRHGRRERPGAFLVDYFVYI